MANLALAEAAFEAVGSRFAPRQALLPTKAISQEDYDKTAGDRDEAAATVDVALAARNSAEENLKYTTVRAKVAGRVSRQMVDPGNMVRANDTALTTIVSTNRMYIYFDVHERTSDPQSAG